MKRDSSIFENEYFQKAIDSLPTAVYTTDAEGCLTYFNSAAVEFSGCEPHLGTDQWYLTWKLFYPDGTPMPHEECPMVIALKEGRSIKGAEGILERPDGNRSWFEAYPSPLFDEEGKVVGGINMLLDITERKKARQKLQDVNQTLEKRVQERTKKLKAKQDHLHSLVSQLSKAEELERQRLAGELHDNLGQILALGRMKINSLQKYQLPEPTVQEIDEIKELINDALTYTRELMSDLKPPPSLEKNDVRPTIEWIAKKMKKHDLTVIVDDDEEPKPTSEEVRIILLQSVRELLFNIIKHADEDVAWIIMSRLGDNVQIIVEDNGRGFDPSNINKSSIEEGGFGLYHIQERMDMLDGSIDIFSEPGEGTKIKLVVPLKDDNNSDSSPDYREPQKQSAQN